jgi:SAM-dependent methyltransferase
VPDQPERPAYRYEGDELDVFALARNWKAHLRRRIAPFLAGQVLEVGAGIGATTRALAPDSGVDSWTCLEPDPALASRLKATLDEPSSPVRAEIRRGTIGDLGPTESFDAILYIDVLEHIEDDATQLLVASGHLNPGGHLIVLAPAHQLLYSPFDRAIGHHRRYDLRMLRALRPRDLVERRAEYLDSAGMTLSLANRLLLRSDSPSAAQVRFWDRFVIPASRLLDPLLGRRLGKSVLIVWERPRPPLPPGRA